MTEQPIIMYALKSPRGKVLPSSISLTSQEAWKRGPDLPSKLREKRWTAVKVEVREVS